MDDYAVVVGISKYPSIRGGEGASADLDGPDNDAQAIYDWLVDPRGGAVPPANAVLIRSADLHSPGDPQPAAEAVRKAFVKLIRLADPANDQSYSNVPAGRRLYVYMSGHGFSPRIEEAALFTAEADTVLLTFHIYAHAWLRWFREGGFFQEFVLWMDCCMHPGSTIIPEVITFRRRLATGSPPPAFIGLAARSGSALELPMSDDKVHGVFTWTLVQGLKGAAARNGAVTGESLKDYVYNGMIDFIPEDRRSTLDVDVRPYVHSDPGLGFAHDVQQRQPSLRLRFGAVAEGHIARVWDGKQRTPVTTGVVAAGAFECKLTRGLYVCDVPNAGLRQGFEVTGTGGREVMVAASDIPVAIANINAQFDLEVTSSNPTALISVIDHNFERVLRSSGSTKSRQPIGVYKIRAQLGRDVATMAEEIVLLDRNLTRDLSPALASPAPIVASALVHEHHTDAFDALSRIAPTGGSALTIIARFWSHRSGESAPDFAFPHPFTGLEVLDGRNKLIGNLAEHGTVDPGDGTDPLAKWGMPLEPGIYFLRHRLAGGRVLEQSIVVASGWETHVAIRRPNVVARTRATRLDSVGDMTILMRRPGMSEFSEQHLIEGARLALRDDYALYLDDAKETAHRLLVQKFNNPIAGLLGAHLLLREYDSLEPARQREKLEETEATLDEVVGNLRRLVVHAHPDVEAISLRASAGTRTNASFAFPPMFRRSWELIVAASATNPKLVPKKLWERVRAISGTPMYFTWARDKTSRESNLRQLHAWADDLWQLQGAATPETSLREAIAAYSLDVNAAAAGPGPGPASAADPLQDIYALATNVNIPAVALDALLPARLRRRR